MFHLTQLMDHPARLRHLNHMHDLMRLKHPPTLVRSYRIEGLTAAGAWTELAEVDDNLLRHRIHGFPPQRLKAVRITVLSTWGDPSARIFEVRVY